MAQTIGRETISDLAGQPAPGEILVDLVRLEREYYARKPDMGDPNQRVTFGTSGHRGSPLAGAFTEAHIAAITQATWFAARPSGTENIYKVYAESFVHQSHLDAIVAEARAIVDSALGSSA